MSLILRPYQEEAVGRFVERIDHVPRGGLIVLPTGSGKSCVMAELTAWWLANRKGGIGIVSHRKELVRQNAEEYDELVGRTGACIKEQGSDHRATLDDWERVRAGGVISFTVQTLQNRRLLKVSRDSIGLLLVDECFTGDTEILTENGFVRLDRLAKDVRVAQYEHGGSLTFTMPTDYICNDYDGYLVRMHSDRGCDLLMTPGHELLYRLQGKDVKAKACDTSFGHGKEFYVAGKMSGVSRNLTPRERLMIALQADGYRQSKGVDPFSIIGFSFSKERKINRFLKLMEDGGFHWSEIKGTKANGNIKGSRKFLVKSLCGASKNLWDHFKLKDIDFHLAREIVEEMTSWDGYINAKWPLRREYCSTNESQADFYQTVAVMAGYKTFRSTQVNECHKDLHRVFVDTKTSMIGSKQFKKEAVPYTGKVYCVSVPSGNIVVRRLGKVMVIGNCHRIKDQGQYDKVRDYFGCKWVGLTATPDRTDGQKLVGKMFDEAWYGDRQGQLLNDFIEQGWLTPPKIRHIHVASLEWKWLRGRSGKDFTNEQVGKVWQDFKSIHQFVAPIVREVGKAKTLYFCPKVVQAKAVADVINSTSHPRRIADYVASYKIDEDGNRSDYPKEYRRKLIARIGRVEDELQHLANMGVFVEGTNIPIIAAIGWLRFTKSRLLLTQGVGRALRTWPGILRGLERATAAMRRDAIARSPKPHALIFDPTKRAGTKLSLAHMIDVLRPDMSPEVRDRALTLIGQHGKNNSEYDPREIIEEAKHLESPFFKGLRAALMEIKPDIQYRLHEVDPYSGNEMAVWERAPKEEAKHIGDASDKQKSLIKKLAPSEYSEEFYQSLGRKQAGSIIDKLMKNPPVAWILKRLAGMHIATIPTTNKQGLDLLRQGRTQ